MRTLTLLLCSMLLLAPLAMAQATGPDVDDANATIYAHTNGDDSEQWMNTIQEDGDPGTVTYYGEPAIEVSRDFPLVGAVASGAELDPTGNVVFNLYSGSGCCVNYGTWTVTLTHAGEVLAEASTESSQEVGYSLKSMTVPLSLDEPLALTEDLVWTVAFEGGGTSFMQVGQSGSFSNIVLPILPMPDSGAPRVTHTNITSNNVTINGTFDAPSDDQFVYNWTQDAADLDIALDANGTGNISIVMTDGNGTEVLNSTYTAGSHVESIRDATPGDWVIAVDLAAFNGSYELAILPFVAPTDDAPDDQPDPSGNMTDDGNGTSDEGEDSPALPLAAVVVAVFALALRRRDQ